MQASTIPICMHFVMPRYFYRASFAIIYKVEIHKKCICHLNEKWTLEVNEIFKELIQKGDFEKHFCVKLGRRFLQCRYIEDEKATLLSFL